MMLQYSNRQLQQRWNLVLAATLHKTKVHVAISLNICTVIIPTGEKLSELDETAADAKPTKEI